MKPRNFRTVWTLIIMILLLSIMLISAATPPADAQGGPLLLADFEEGIPSGFNVFNDAIDGSGSTTTLTIATVAEDLPLVPGGSGNTAVSIDYDIATSGSWGGGPGYGGVTHDFTASQDWSNYGGFSFWFYGGSSGLTFQAEIFDNGADAAGAERFDYEFVDDFSGWKLFEIPFTDFTRATDFQPAGAPDDGLTLTEMWGYAFVLAPGTGSIFIDQIEVNLLGPGVIAPLNLALGQPAFSSSNESAGLSPDKAVDGDLSTRWASAFADNQWIYVDLGANAEINRVVLTWEAAFGSVYDIQVSDDASSWTTVFSEAGGDGGVDEIDGLTASGRYVRMLGITRATPFGFSLFEFEVFGTYTETAVSFASSEFSVEEGETATITVKLNREESSEVTVTYATSDGTATDGEDYTGVTGTLTFPPGSTEQTFTVDTLDDPVGEDDETVLLTLSNPVNASLGARPEATLRIVDNDATPLPVLNSLLIDDFESGIPAGFQTFGGENPTISLVPEPLPGVPGPNTALRVDYNISSFGGIVHDITPAQDWSDFQGIRFWFFGQNSGSTYQFEIKDGGTGPAQSELWEVFFVDDFTGWRQLVFPFSDFQLRTSFQPTGGPINGTLDLTEMWGYAFGLPSGTGPGSFLLDQVEVIAPGAVLDNFEDPVPFGFPEGIFTFQFNPADTPSLTPVPEPGPRPGASSPNQVLRVYYDIEVFGGLVHNLTFDTNPQDWSDLEGFRFWFFGTNEAPLPPGSGPRIQLEIKDGGVNAEASELWEVFFTDDFAGWTQLVIPFEDFRIRTSFQPTGGPINGTLDLTEMWGYAFGLPAGVPDQTFFLDQVEVFGFAPPPARATVDFTEAVYLVNEGDTATAGVVLDTPDGEPLVDPLTVGYSTADGTATAGSDYTATSGTVTFDAGDGPGTVRTFTVATNVDGEDELAETITLNLDVAPDVRTSINTPGTVVINAHGFPYLDPNVSISDRMADLLSRMSLDEKIGQMTLIERAVLTENSEDIANFWLGAVLSGGGSAPTPNTPEAWADMVDGFQRRALQTRLQIPLIYGVDAVHGHNNVIGATIFPHNIGLGATRNAELVEEAGRITAKEVYATGIPWDFSPCLCVARDERWGRTYESFGEDPSIATMMTTYIDGLQGNDLSAPNTVLATAKHWIADGGTTFGSSTTGAYTIDQGITEATLEELRELHIPPYEAAIARDVGVIMPSYSSVDFLDGNGPLKMHAHAFLNNEVLKGELGFDGFIVSDWQGIDQIPGDRNSDVRTGINAGIDMVMVPFDYNAFTRALKEEVDASNVSMERIDDAVSRILIKKFELGLFEQPFSDRTELDTVGSQEHRDVARQAVRESLVLLKNEGNLLPLSKDLNVYVAGRNADDIGHQAGGWTISWQGDSGDTTPGTTILEGIQQIVSPASTVTFSQNGSAPRTGHDVGIVVVGETPYAEGFGDVGNIIPDLLLSAEDQAVVETVCADLACVVVLVSGRPMIINDQLDRANAFVAAWLPGTEGDGVAEVLFGDHNFKGRLPMSWPRSMEQLPINVPTSCSDEYDPLFAFGFGLGYAQTDVEIDIKPGGDPNAINCKNDNQVITVAVLTTDSFDALAVDHATVTFEGASETHLNKSTGKPQRHEADVDGDGDTDLVFHFRLGDTHLTVGSPAGTLTGETFDGRFVIGTDAVNLFN